MSETDDTDVLLLIPPDFFLVQSSGSEDSLLESSRTVVHKPQSCTAQVIGKLVTQVYSLESRLESLEISTTVTDSSVATLPRRKNWDTDSFDGPSVDRKFFTFPRRRRRKVNKRGRTQDSSLASLDSASTRKSVPRLKLFDSELASIVSKPETNDSPSMDGDISSIMSTPNKKDDKLLLHEIDEFLTKVESYESPESKSKDQETLSPENVIKATGDYISHKLDSKNVEDIKLPSGRTVPSNVLDKYIYLVRNNSRSGQNDKPSTSAHSLKNNEEFSTNPETTKASDMSYNAQEAKSPSIRRLNFSESKDVQPTSTPKRPQSSYLESFKPSSNKIYERATKVLEQYKSSNCSNTLISHPESSYSTREEFKMPQMRPYVSENKGGMKLTAMQNKFMDSLDTDLLSLSELWGERGDKTDRGESNKLEEERFKREHCEAMIQQLQKKLLEQQEKLAVAIKVDRAKDAAILKLREAWLKLSGSLERAERRHAAALGAALRDVDHYKMVASESQKKTNHFEAELYKALDLAHDYQEKCKQLSADWKLQLDSAESTLAARGDVIRSRDKEIQMLKENYETVMRLNKQATDCVKSLEEALEKKRSEHELTKSKMLEVDRKMQCMADEASIAAQQRDVLRGKVQEERARGNMLERQLADKQNLASELLNKCDTLDGEVKSLRQHLELQKNELKSHYQKQLEDAVIAKLQEFQQQLDLAEREMENAARGKENAIVDTYNKQISRIEEQHKLEVSVLEEKQREEIKLYRLQLAQSSEKIGLLESKLESYRRRRGQIASQLHGVMEAQWRQALRILTHPSASLAAPSPSRPGSLDHTARDDTVSTMAQDYAPPKVPPSMPFDKPPPPPGRGEQLFNFEGLSDHELQHYVKMLLTKPALEGGRARDVHEEPTSDRDRAPPPAHGAAPPDPPERRDPRDPPERRGQARRALNSSGGSKPPWKA